MIRRDHPELSLSRQCRLLSISRSSLYQAPQGESAENLELMRRIDELFLKYPFYGSRQMVRHLWRDGVRVGRHRVRFNYKLTTIGQGFHQKNQAIGAGSPASCRARAGLPGLARGPSRSPLVLPHCPRDSEATPAYVDVRRRAPRLIINGLWRLSARGGIPEHCA